jgi:hypothetical protein
LSELDDELDEELFLEESDELEESDDFELDSLLEDELSVFLLSAADFDRSAEDAFDSLRA